MRHEDRKQLLAAYAVALVAERESWARLHEPGLAEAQRCRTLAEWKQITAGLRALARQLRAAPATVLPAEPQAPGSSRADPRAAAPGKWEAEAAAVTATAPVAATAGTPRRPLPVHCLAASVRLLTALRAKLETAVPRLGPL